MIKSNKMKFVLVPLHSFSVNNIQEYTYLCVLTSFCIFLPSTRWLFRVSTTMGGPILSILFQQREKWKEMNGQTEWNGRKNWVDGVHVHISLHVIKTTRFCYILLMSYHSHYDFFNIGFFCRFERIYN